jgi:tRNA G18 (ribose-2'-O)-methylase SpoU
MQVDSAADHPQVTFLIENPKKNTNWGPLLRCGAAFGITQIFVVGYDTCSVQGSHGASKHVELVSFPTHQQAAETLKKHDYELLGLLGGVANADDENGYHVTTSEQTSTIDKSKTETIVSVSNSSKDIKNQSLPKSYAVHCRPFSQNTCLVVGKRALGLPLRLAELCQKFLHIPHQAEVQLTNTDEKANNLTSWLNGEACVSIILHEFSAWAGFHAENYQGQKYKVIRITKGAPDNQDAKRNERKRKMEERLQEGQEDRGNFFQTDDDDGDY